MVMADEDAISQVLVNLFSNAEKYGPGGKSLELRTWKEDRILHVAVLDRGPGVPPGQETKIFEAFYRASDSLDSGAQGSGLGLALANRIIMDHGGTLLCSPRKGGGACFTFTLPLL
jgi:signal transduction histidine kinase